MCKISQGFIRLTLRRLIIPKTAKSVTTKRCGAVEKIVEAKVSVRGKTYRMLFTSEQVPSDSDGIIDLENKTIRIRPSIKGRRLCEVVIHELLHARFPYMHEQEILWSARNVADSLQKLKLLK